MNIQHQIATPFHLSQILCWPTRDKQQFKQRANQTLQQNSSIMRLAAKQAYIIDWHGQSHPKSQKNL
jgi:hypothetical protein